MADESTTERYYAQLFRRLEAHGIENETGVPLYEGEVLKRFVQQALSNDRDPRMVSDAYYAASKIMLLPCPFTDKHFIICHYYLFYWQIQAGVEQAIEYAKQFFLYDAQGHYKNHKIWFKTLYRQENGAVTEALVIPPKNGDSGSFEIILPHGPTHRVRNPNDNSEYDVRIMVQVDRRTVDPFDFRFSTSF